MFFQLLFTRQALHDLAELEKNTSLYLKRLDFRFYSPRLGLDLNEWVLKKCAHSYSM